MTDTSSSIEKRMRQMIASRTPTDRLRMASSMFDTGKKLIKAGILHENGPLNESRLRTRIFLKLYGDCFTPSQIAQIINEIPGLHQDTQHRDPE